MPRFVPFPLFGRRPVLTLAGLVVLAPFIGPRLFQKWSSAETVLAADDSQDSPAPSNSDESSASGQADLAPQEPTVTDTGYTEWVAFRERFITPDGRVIDTGKGGISHSEGQGYGLLFAEAFGDAETFRRIYEWTTSHLRRDDNALHMWRYDPAAADPVADPNNATDGDIMIAAALSRAGRRWHRPELIRAARAIAHDIDRLLTRQVGQRMVLLPGLRGFETADAVIINPSYYAFNALTEINTLISSARLRRVQTDGYALIREGRFGRWQLPPDWLSISRRDGTLAPAPRWPARFSYDAIRVLLYLTEAGLTVPGLRASFTAYWNEKPGFHPAWVDLCTGEIAPYPASPGIQAVADFFLRANGEQLASASVPPAELPTINAQTDYYSAALIVLTYLSWRGL